MTSRIKSKSRAKSKAPAKKKKQAQKKKKDLFDSDEYYDYLDSPGLYDLDPYYKQKYRKDFEKYLKEKKKEEEHKKKKEKYKEKYKHDLSDYGKYNLHDFYKHLKEKDRERYMKAGPKASRAYNEKIQEELQKEIAQIEADNQQAFAKLEQLVNGYLQEWIQIAPRTLEEAVEVAKVCGEPCFLNPSTGDYAVCPRCGPTGCYCAPMCSGLYNANLLAQRRGDRHALQLSRKLALEFGCDWALILNAYLQHKYPNAVKKFY